MYLNRPFEPLQESYLPLYLILEFSSQVQSHYIFVFIFGFIAAHRWLNDPADGATVPEMPSLESRQDY
jgi:hypothetical protein